MNESLGQLMDRHYVSLGILSALLALILYRALSLLFASLRARLETRASAAPSPASRAGGEKKEARAFAPSLRSVRNRLT